LIRAVAKVVGLNTYYVSVFLRMRGSKTAFMIEEFIARGHFEMSEVNESQSKVQVKENPLTGFDALDEFAAFFEDDIPEDPQEIFDNLLSARER
jgi:hypothetical protein